MQGDSKSRVRDFWDAQSCGEVYADGNSEAAYFQSQADARYKLEPIIREFARFNEGVDKDILEIGVGMGADHVEWAKSSPRVLKGVDLTSRAVHFTQRRLALAGLQSDVVVADAELLPFPDNSFDIVYSWGVLHHSPDTARAFAEAHRVLRPGGTLRAMIYHKKSLVGYMLWLRYGLMRGRPFLALVDVYSEFLESPGTKAYTRKGAIELVNAFSEWKIQITLSPGDLLMGAAGQRHQGPTLRIARLLWPRRYVLRFLSGLGLFMLVEARK